MTVTLFPFRRKTRPNHERVGIQARAPQAVGWLRNRRVDSEPSAAVSSVAWIAPIEKSAAIKVTTSGLRTGLYRLLAGLPTI
jgi:hypothetical protein